MRGRGFCEGKILGTMGVKRMKKLMLAEIISYLNWEKHLRNPHGREYLLSTAPAIFYSKGFPRPLIYYSIIPYDWYLAIPSTARVVKQSDRKNGNWGIGIEPSNWRQKSYFLPSNWRQIRKEQIVRGVYISTPIYFSMPSNNELFVPISTMTHIHTQRERERETHLTMCSLLV